MKKNKGFVLMETIVVITVLGVVLAMLYTSYSSILKKISRQSHYDNTEYIYKTLAIKNTLIKDLSPNSIGQSLKIIDKNSYSYSNDLFQYLDINGIYIINCNDITDEEIKDLDLGTQKYIDSIESCGKTNYKLIVVYNSPENKKGHYEYASLDYGEPI